MNKRNIILFLSILIVAFSLRFYGITEIPPSLNWDEVSIGYNAYSVLETGKDEWGQFLPLSFRAFGDYKLPVYIYTDTIFIKMFGLNSLAVKLPSLLAGIGIVICIFLIVKNLTKNTLLALTGMFIATILPWLIITSRIALEANLALFLATLSFYFFLLSLQKKYYFFLSNLFFGLTLFTYNSYRVLAIPLLFLVFLFFKDNIKNGKREIIASLFLICTFFAFVLPLSILRDSEARYRWITILDEGSINRINEARGSSLLPAPLPDMIYNKATYFIFATVQNYIKYYNPDFLFINGGSNYQFSVPGSGQLYFLILPLLILGFIQVALEKKKWQFFIIFWLIVSPLPGAVTRDAPHSLRTLTMVIPVVLLAVLGIDLFQKKLKQNLFIMLLFLALIFLSMNTYIFWQNYSKDYIKNYSWVWQYGYREIVDYIKENNQQYNQVIITKKYGEPHEFLLFFLKYNPDLYQTDKNLIRYKKSDWFWVDGFNKYRFINDWEIKEKLASQHNILLITDPGNYPERSRLLKTINFLNGERAFDIVAIE